MTIIGIVEQSLRAHVYLNLPLDMPARSKALVAYLVTLKSKRGTCPSCENPICLKLNHFFVLLLFLLQIFFAIIIVIYRLAREQSRGRRRRRIQPMQSISTDMIY